MTTRSDRPTYQLSRRTFLRGLGVTMALPWLESLPVWGDEPTGHAPASEPPVRLAVLFSGNGFHSKEWWAKGEGTRHGAGQGARAARPLPREDALHPRPLQRGGPEGEHPQLADRQPALRARRWPPAARSARARASTRSLAQTHGATRPRCRAWCSAASSRSPSVHKNYSMLYSSHISWSSPTTPTPLELYPALAFDRLFKDEVGKGDKSVLDAVLDDASDLRGTISTADQRKLDEYLDSVREVEQRIEQAGKDGRAAGLAADARQARTCPRPADGIPQDIAEHMRLMCDILVLGLPDRHDARLHAEAEQRPLVAAVPATWAWTT